MSGLVPDSNSDSNFGPEQLRSRAWWRTHQNCLFNASCKEIVNTLRYGRRSYISISNCDVMVLQNSYSPVPITPVCDALIYPSLTDSVCLVVCFLFLLGRPNCAGAVDDGRSSGVASGLGERRGRGRSGDRISRYIDCSACIDVGCEGVAGTIIVSSTACSCT